jgi:hypothetical protein
MARVGSNLLKLQPQRSKVVVDIAPVQIEGNTLGGVNPADDLFYSIEQLQAAGADPSPLILLAYQDIDGEDPENVTKDATVTHVVVKLEYDGAGTLSGSDAGSMAYATGNYHFDTDSGNADSMGPIGKIYEVVDDSTAYVWVNASLG